MAQVVLGNLVKLLLIMLHKESLLPRVVAGTTDQDRSGRRQVNDRGNSLLAIHGDLGSTTQNLVTGFQITPFGRYRCHRPNGPEEKMVRKR
jgi:hypothetical protein